MINQQLLDYIKQQTQQGISPDNIKNALHSNGWTEADIDEAFNNSVTPITYNGVASIQTNQISKPRGVRVISILYFLGSLLALGFGALALSGASFFTQILGTGFFGKFFAIGGVIFIALGVLGIFMGVGLWRYKNWARWTAIILSVAGIIMSIASILKGSVFGNIFNVAVDGIISSYLFFSPKVRSIFEPEKDIVSLNKKLLWVFIVLLSLVVGVAAVFGSQVVVSSDKASIQEPIVVSPITTPTPTPAPAEEPKIVSPKESYLIMKKEADNIKNYADMEAYTLKYGSKEQTAKLEINKKQIDALPQSFKDQIVALAKNPLSSEITIIQETLNGNTATLDVQTTKLGLTGVVTLVLEDGQWKMELESWEQK